MIRILWIIFYILTGSFILFYFIKEKTVTNKIDEIANKISEYLKKDMDDKLIKCIDVINFLVALFVIVMYLTKMDRSPSDIIPIKTPAMLIILGLNLFVFILRKNYEIVIIANTVMLFFSTSIFGIDDMYFNLTVGVTLVFSIIFSYFKQQELYTTLKRTLNGFVVILIVVIFQTFFFGNYVVPTGSMIPTIQIKDRFFSNNIKYKFLKPELGDIIAYKEPMHNRSMYTKRITGKPGQTFKIDETGTIVLDNFDSKLNRTYSLAGLFGSVLDKDETVYIPKKGDEVSLAVILELDEEKRELNLLTGQEFLAKYKEADTYKDLFSMFHNEKGLPYSYSFFLSAKNVDRLLLPIQDFKYDKKTMDKLLSGESIILDDNYYMTMGDNTENSLDSRFFGYVKESRIRGQLLFRFMPLNRMGVIK